MKSEFREPRPWWSEPYVWLVLGLPLVSVLACLVTAIFVLRDSEGATRQERLPQAETMARQLQSARAGGVPAMVGRNHSATGGVRHDQP